MIVDTFLFLNELDILEARLNYLDPVVDYFVLVESNITFSGNRKPLFFCENQQRFSKFKHKIIYYPFLFDNSIHKFDFSFNSDRYYADYISPQWQVEYMQRNHIAKALRIFDDNDFVLLSDVDEIPMIEAINFSVNNTEISLPASSFITKLFFYNLNTMHEQEWPSIVFTTKAEMVRATPQYLRGKHRDHLAMPHLANAGWHLSYFGGSESIQYKVQSYAHQENNKQNIINKSNIETSISQGKSFLLDETKFRHVERTDYTLFPPNFQKAFDRFFI